MSCLTWQIQKPSDLSLRVTTQTGSSSSLWFARSRGFSNSKAYLHFTWPATLGETWLYISGWKHMPGSVSIPDPPEHGVTSPGGMTQVQTAVYFYR